MIPLILLGVGIAGLAKTKKDADKSMSDNSLDKFDSLFKLYGTKNKVPWLVLKRISWVESKVGIYPSVARGLKNPNDIKMSVSDDGLSWGLMQMTLKTAHDYDPNVTAQKLNNAEYSIDLASRLLKDLIRIFPNERDFVMAYNQGQGNQKNFILKEKNKTLLKSEYADGRKYWDEYIKSKQQVG